MAFKTTTRGALGAASAAVMAAALVACGGGGSSTTATPVASVTQTLTGVAATGAAMDGATITITDSKGASITKTAGADGSFSADITSMTAPLLITATKQVGDTMLTLTSVAIEKPAAGATGTANVTPLTDALAALIAPNGNPSELTDSTVLAASATKAKVDASAAALNAAIATVLTDAGLDPSKFNIITTPFTANRSGADRVLEIVKVEHTGQGVSLTNTSVADNGAGSASVQVTSATTAVSAPQLPAPPANTVLGEQDHFATLAEACLADAPSVRAPTVDASGVPTSLSAACAAVPFATTYKSGGFTFKQRYATMLTSSDFTGAKFAKPERLFTYTDGRVFFRMSYKTAGGIGNTLSDVAQKTSPTGKSYKWEVVGNQRDYDSSIEVQLDNWNSLNPNNNAAYEYGKSQHLVSVNLFFNPTNASGLNVQIARVKGPGLPSSGITFARSAACGSDGYLSLANKTGSLVDSSNASLLYTFNSGTVFRLSGALKSNTAIDWTKYATNSFFRDTAMSDAALTAIPSFAEYTWELWLFGSSGSTRVARTNITNATAPDFTYTQRLTSRLPTPVSLRTMPWNTINANDFLVPTSAMAAPQTAVTVSWKALADPVNFVYASGGKFVAATSTSVSSFASARADSSATGVKITDTSKTISAATDTGTGTSTLAGVIGANSPATSCATNPSPFPAFDGVAGTYSATYGSAYTSRSLGIRSRNSNLVRKTVLNRWDNNPQ
jgi:hypothetical protein